MATKKIEIIEEIDKADINKIVVDTFNKILTDKLKPVFQDLQFPRMFLIYAHDSSKKDELRADASIAQELIRWLQQVGLNIYSDRSPHGNQTDEPKPQDVTDVLWSQLKILPKVSQNVDYVILCCSEFLGKFANEEKSKDFFNNVFAALNRQRSFEPKQIKQLVQAQINNFSDYLDTLPDETFHHVLTELAFLHYRLITDEEKYQPSMIAMKLNENSQRIWPEFINPTDIWISDIKHRENREWYSSDEHAKHKAFFELLKRLFNSDNEKLKIINNWFDFYTQIIKLFKKNEKLSQDIINKLLEKTVNVEQIENNYFQLKLIGVKETVTTIVRRRYKEPAFAELKRLLYERTFPITESFTNLAIVKEHEQKSKDELLKAHAIFYREDYINSFEMIYQPKQPIKLKELFSPTSDENKSPKRQLIEGRAGIGKTTLCQYLAYEWAIDDKKIKAWPQFDWVIHLSLRMFNETEQQDFTHFTLVHWLYEHYLTKAEQQHINEAELKLTFDELNSQGKVLLLLDGYDEVVPLLKSNQSFQNFFDNQLLACSYWLLFSRPYYFTSNSSDRRLENIGFTKKDIPKYVRQFFHDIEKEKGISQQDKMNNLIDYLEQNPNVMGIAHIPINLELLCGVWETGSKLNSQLTFTELYDRLVLSLFGRYLHKFYPQIFSSVSGITWEDIKEDKDYQCQQILDFLQQLAWQQMQKPGLIIPAETIKQLTKNFYPELKQTPQREILGGAVLKHLGVLKGCDVHKPTLEQSYYFIHLTFQEYFAACYLFKLFKSVEKQNEAIKLVETHKSNPRYEIIWWFLAGLLSNEDKNNNKHKFFKKPTTLLTEKFINIFTDESWDLLKTYKVPLLIRCLDEAININPELKIKFTPLIEQVDNWVKHLFENNQHKNNYLKQLVRRRICDCLKVSPFFLGLYPKFKEIKEDKLEGKVLSELISDSDNLRSSRIETIKKENKEGSIARQLIIMLNAADNSITQFKVARALCELDNVDENIINKITNTLSLHPYIWECGTLDDDIRREVISTLNKVIQKFEDKHILIANSIIHKFNEMLDLAKIKHMEITSSIISIFNSLKLNENKNVEEDILCTFKRILEAEYKDIKWWTKPYVLNELVKFAEKSSSEVVKNNVEDILESILIKYETCLHNTELLYYYIVAATGLYNLHKNHSLEREDKLLKEATNLIADKIGKNQNRHEYDELYPLINGYGTLLSLYLTQYRLEDNPAKYFFEVLIRYSSRTDEIWFMYVEIKGKIKSYLESNALNTADENKKICNAIYEKLNEYLNNSSYKMRDKICAVRAIYLFNSLQKSDDKNKILMNVKKVLLSNSSSARYIASEMVKQDKAYFQEIINDLKSINSLESIRALYEIDEKFQINDKQHLIDSFDIKNIDVNKLLTLQSTLDNTDDKIIIDLVYSILEKISINNNQAKLTLLIERKISYNLLYRFRRGNFFKHLTHCDENIDCIINTTKYILDKNKQRFDDDGNNLWCQYLRNCIWILLHLKSHTNDLLNQRIIEILLNFTRSDKVMRYDFWFWPNIVKKVISLFSEELRGKNEILFKHIINFLQDRCKDIELTLDEYKGRYFAQTDLANAAYHAAVALLTYFPEDKKYVTIIKNLLARSDSDYYNSFRHDAIKELPSYSSSLPREIIIEILFGLLSDDNEQIKYISATALGDFDLSDYLSKNKDIIHSLQNEYFFKFGLRATSIDILINNYNGKNDRLLSAIIEQIITRSIIIVNDEECNNNIINSCENDEKKTIILHNQGEFAKELFSKFISEIGINNYENSRYVSDAKKTISNSL